MIEAAGLACSYRTKHGAVPAVAGVDLSVEKGEIVGFLGPNGAGKTTTVRMLTTLLTPTGGSASVAGYDVVRERAQVRARIGYVGQSGFPSEHRVGDELVVQARLCGMRKAAAVRRSAELAEAYQLDGLMDTPLTQLSGGQRRRFEIAVGVVHQPAVLFLDEPTAALDPQSRANVWDHVRALRAEHGTTIFLTTHYLDEADVLCDRIFVIDGGRIVACDTPAALKADLGGDAVSLRTPDLTIAEVVLSGQAGVLDLSARGESVQFHIAHAAGRLPDLLRELDRAGVRVEAVTTSQPSLDDVFLKLTGRSLREQVAGRAAGVPGLPAMAGPAPRPVTTEPTAAAQAEPVPATEDTTEYEEVLAS